MAQPPRNSIPLLALAGLGSALFTLVVASAGFSERISVGFIFGIALAAYFVWYEGYRDSAKMAAFVGACTVAFPAALSSVVPLMIVFQVHVSMVSGKVDTPMPVFFGAGCIGALIVLAAGILLIGSQRVTRNFLGVIVFWSLGGGVLGVIGGALDMIRTQGVGNQAIFPFLVWQPGVAILLGLLLERTRKSPPKPSPDSGSSA